MKLRRRTRRMTAEPMLGLINVSLAQLFKTWWPAILIAVGISLLFTRENRNSNRPKD